MLRRFALYALLLPVAFAGCSKAKSLIAKQEQKLKGSPSPNPTVAAAATATPVPTPAKPAIDQNAQVVIFGYHRFEKTVHRPDTEMTPEMFEGQMKMLKDRNIPVISMQDFLAWKRGEKNIPPKAAIITFDDGWKTQYEVGWPIMKKYGYPFTLFIYTEGVKGMKYGGGAAMSWEMLSELRDAGADIEAHSATHQDLRKPFDRTLKKKLSPEEYQEFLQREVIGSKELLESKLAIKVNCFAVPFGYINDQVRQYISKAGYEGVFTVYGQHLTYSSPNDSLGRYLMEGNKPKVFEDAINFGAGTNAPAVAEYSTTDLQAQPADGETVQTAMPLIKANLTSMGQIDKGSVQMRISGVGLVQPSFDEATNTVTYQPTQKMKEKTVTVIIAATSGGKRVEAHWTFNIDEAALNAPAATPAPPAAAPSPSPAKKK
jgi:peptidoglycan/xylan/chitin deacetylase (PgdA/CDA1 family)